MAYASFPDLTIDRNNIGLHVVACHLYDMPLHLRTHLDLSLGENHHNSGGKKSTQIVDGFKTCQTHKRFQNDIKKLLHDHKITN